MRFWRSKSPRLNRIPLDGRNKHLMKTESVREHFRIQVPDYQGLMRRLIPFYDNQRDVMLALIPFDRGVSLRVLDLGCGPGLMAARILAEFPHAQLTLFDLTAEMIEACQSRLEGTDRIVYQVGDDAVGRASLCQACVSKPGTRRTSDHRGGDRGRVAGGS